MDILNTKRVLAIGLTSAMSIGTATADISEDDQHTQSPIISISSPDLRVTVYDGIATLFGTAASSAEAKSAEQEIKNRPGIVHVINLITWS